jgi:hypothetical protein
MKKNNNIPKLNIIDQTIIKHIVTRIKKYFNQYCHNHYHTKKELYREWERNRYNTDFSFRIKKSYSSPYFRGFKNI